MSRTAKKRAVKKAAKKKMTKNMKGRPRGGASVPCPQCRADSRVLVTRRIDGEVTRNRTCTRGHAFLTTERVA